MKKKKTPCILCVNVDTLALSIIQIFFIHIKQIFKNVKFQISAFLHRALIIYSSTITLCWRKSSQRWKSLRACHRSKKSTWSPCSRMSDSTRSCAAMEPMMWVRWSMRTWAWRCWRAPTTPTHPRWKWRRGPSWTRHSSWAMRWMWLRRPYEAERCRRRRALAINNRLWMLR